MTQIPTTGALALCLCLSALGAAAQSDEQDQQAQSGASDAPASATALKTSEGQLIPANRFDGAPLYVAGDPDRGGWSATTVFEGRGDGWTEVGQVSDLVLSQDSSYAGILAELDDRSVFLSIQDLALVLLDDKEVAYVTKLSESELSDLPEPGPDLQ